MKNNFVLSGLVIGGLLAAAPVAFAHRSRHTIARELESSGNGPQMISSLFNNMCVAFKNSNLMQDHCDSTQTTESFLFTKIGSGYTIAPAQTPELCLQDYGTMQIISAPCNGATNQLWRESAADIGIHLVNVASSRCMNVAGKSKSVNGAIVAYECGGEDNEQFMVSKVVSGSPPRPTPTPVPSPTPPPEAIFVDAGPKIITSLLSSLCVEFKNGELIQNPCDVTSARQSFVLAALGSALYQISPAGNLAQCLQDNDNALISSATCANLDKQKWYIAVAFKGVNLINADTQKCFNIEGSSKLPKAAVISYKCDGAWNSQFSLTNGATTIVNEPFRRTSPRLAGPKCGKQSNTDCNERRGDVRRTP